MDRDDGQADQLVTGGDSLNLSPADRERTETQGQRRRLMTGCWMVDAIERQVAFYSKESRDHLPAPDLSRNPLLELVLQLATLYDDAATIGARGARDEDMERLIPPRVWAAVMADRLKHQVGTNEVLIRLDMSLDEKASDRRLGYRVVYADTVTEVVKDPRDDRRLLAVRECRLRTRPGTREDELTWETWDVSGVEPVFRIEAERKNAGGATVVVDVTVEYSASSAYPYVDGEGPILPYAIAHARIGAHLWDCDSGAEVVSGTLTGSALVTMWVGGLRDNASPPIYTKDLTILKQGVGGVLAGATETVRMDNSTILQTMSKPGTNSGEISRLPAGADPKSSFEAIELYFAGLGASFGVTADDVTRGQAGASGYAMVLSRAGQRRARKRLEGPCGVADQIILSTGARLLNAYGGTKLPTKPEDYEIAYAQIELSPEEVKAMLEETKGLLEAGLISHFMAMKRHHPNKSDDQIREIMAEIEAEKAAKVKRFGAPPPILGAASKPEPESQDPPPAAAPEEAEEQDGG